MKKFQIEIVVLLAICYFISVRQVVDGNDCECFSSWKTFGIGRRQPGDQLLFRDIKLSNWTIITNHIANFAYSNTNITAWELGMAPNYNYFQYNTFWNPTLNVEVGLSDSFELEAVLTAYGFHTDNLTPNSVYKSKQPEGDVTKIYNSEKTSIN